MNHPYISMSNEAFKYYLKKSQNKASILSEIDQLLSQIELHIDYYPYELDYYEYVKNLRKKVI